MKNRPNTKHADGRCRAARRFTGLVLLMGVANAVAGVSMPLATDPVEPRASQSFDVVYEAFCEDVFPAYAPSNREVEVDAGVVRITVRRLLQFCLGQPYPPTYRWHIGPLPAGSYQVELVGYEYEPQNLFPIASGEVTIAPQVVVTPPNVVPVAGRFGVLSLALLTIVLGMWSLRRR